MENFQNTTPNPNEDSSTFVVMESEIAHFLRENTEILDEDVTNETIEYFEKLHNSIRCGSLPIDSYRNRYTREDLFNYVIDHIKWDIEEQNFDFITEVEMSVAESIGQVRAGLEDGDDYNDLNLSEFFSCNYKSVNDIQADIYNIENDAKSEIKGLHDSLKEYEYIYFTWEGFQDYLVASMMEDTVRFPNYNFLDDEGNLTLENI